MANDRIVRDSPEIEEARERAFGRRPRAVPPSDQGVGSSGSTHQGVGSSGATEAEKQDIKRRQDALRARLYPPMPEE